MSEALKDFYIDGEYDDIVYEIRKEIRPIYERDNTSYDEQALDLSAQIISDILIVLNSEMQDVANYRLGFLSPRKRYYLKIDNKSMSALASFILTLINLYIFTKTAKSGTNPEVNPLECIVGPATVFKALATLKDTLLAKVQEEEFCILLCAHEKTRGEYISIEHIYQRMCSCPYSKLYNAAYGHSCTCQNQNGECSKTKKEIEDIITHLTEFDVLKFNGDLYKIN